MKYTISMEELINRPILTDKHQFEFQNKMTDDEFSQWEKETEFILKESHVEYKFPEWNAAFMSKEIDIDILYKCLKLNYEKS